MPHKGERRSRQRAVLPNAGGGLEGRSRLDGRAHGASPERSRTSRPERPREQRSPWRAVLANRKRAWGRRVGRWGLTGGRSRGGWARKCAISGPGDLGTGRPRGRWDSQAVGRGRGLEPGGPVGGWSRGRLGGLDGRAVSRSEQPGKRTASASRRYLGGRSRGGWPRGGRSRRRMGSGQTIRRRMGLQAGDLGGGQSRGRVGSGAGGLGADSVEPSHLVAGRLREQRSHRRATLSTAPRSQSAGLARVSTECAQPNIAARAALSPQSSALPGKQRSRPSATTSRPAGHSGVARKFEGSVRRSPGRRRETAHWPLAFESSARQRALAEPKNRSPGYRRSRASLPREQRRRSAFLQLRDAHGLPVASLCDTGQRCPAG